MWKNVRFRCAPDCAPESTKSYKLRYKCAYRYKLEHFSSQMPTFSLVVCFVGMGHKWNCWGDVRKFKVCMSLYTDIALIFLGKQFDLSLWYIQKIYDQSFWIQKCNTPYLLHKLI